MNGYGIGKARVEMGVIRAQPEPQAAPKNEPDLLRIPIQMRNPVADKLEGFARENLASGDVEMCVGRKVALCGAGPSLQRATFADDTEAVWATNSALSYLTKNGRHVDVAVGIDQTPGLLREWADPPDVTYYVATTVDPELVRHLRSHERRVLFFHNYVGFEGEREHYETWPPGFIAGEGATVITRAIGLAHWMGYRLIDVFGADCALGSDGAVHANGENVDEAYGNAVLMLGNIDGRDWISRPDMLMTAVELVRLTRRHGNTIRFQPDTLPAALVDKDEKYLDEVMRRLRPEETLADLMEAASG